MAQIELRINADSAADLQQTINELAHLQRVTVSSAESDSPNEIDIRGVEHRAEVALAAAEPTKAKGSRPRKGTETASAPTAEPQPDSSASAGLASGTSVETTSSTTGEKSSGDRLSQQIRQANAEAAAERAADGGAVSLETLQEAFGKAVAPGGKLSMMQAQALLKDNFLTAGGEPVRRIMELQPKDYAAAIAKLAA